MMVDSVWFSWTIDLQNRKFIYLQFSERISHLFSSSNEVPDWWMGATGCDRVQPKVGQSFSIVGSISNELEANLVTKGVVLSLEPHILSGVTLSHSISESDLTLSQLAQAIDNFNSESNGNITHLLKAPINRIRGLTGILIQELNMREHDAMLLDYLKESANRLSTVFNHILSGGKLSPQEARIDIGTVLKEANTLLKHTFGLKGFVQTDQSGLPLVSEESGKMVFEVSIRIMLHNAYSQKPPIAEWLQIDDQTGSLSFRFDTRIHEDSFDFLGVAGIAPPPSSVKILPGSLIIHEVHDDFVEYQIVVNLS